MIDSHEEWTEFYQEHYERDIDDQIFHHDLRPAIAMLAANLHERTTTGVDRRHWSETEVPGREE